jgi:hypothetical protein
LGDLATDCDTERLQKRCQDDLVRIKILRHGLRSTISMDIYLADRLKKKLCEKAPKEMHERGDILLANWVQNTIRQLEEEGTNSYQRIGFSRIIQRRALIELLERLE